MNISLVSSDKLEREKNNLREAITCRHCKSEHLAAVWWHCTAGVHRPASPFISNINGLPRRRGRGSRDPFFIFRRAGGGFSHATAPHQVYTGQSQPGAPQRTEEQK